MRTTRTNRLSTKSEAEELLAFQLKAEGYRLARQHKFHPTRKWLVDFVVSDSLAIGRTIFPARERFMRGVLIVEVEGVTYFGDKLGRHQSHKGFSGDCAKYNELTIMGYPLIRVTQIMVKNGEAIGVINRFFRDEVPVQLPPLPEFNDGK